LNVLDDLSNRIEIATYMKIRRLTPHQKFVAIAALLVVSVISLVFVQRSAVAATWSQATTRQSEHYTSLGFLNTGHMPTYAGAGAMQHVTFRITNHETSFTDYQYRVILSTGSSSSLVKAGAVRLPDGQSADRTVDFVLPSPNMTAQLMVQLVDRPEYITFEVKS
jgi:hypothetical protein